MKRGRRERIEKGIREGIEKRTKRQCEEVGMRDPPPPPPLPPFFEFPCNVAIVSSIPQSMTSWSSSIKIWFLQTYCIIQKICPKICAIGETE